LKEIKNKILDYKVQIIIFILFVFYIYSIYDTILWFTNLDKNKQKNEDMNFINLYCMLVTIILIMICITIGSGGSGGSGVIVM